MLAPPELKRVHSLGKSPVISDGDRVLAESGAIIEYLVEEYGNGLLHPATRIGRSPALPLLDALRGRLGDAAAADEPGLQQGARGAGALAAAAGGPRHRGQGDVPLRARRS